MLGLMRYVHGENGGSATDIENDLVLKEMLVLENRVHVGSCPNLVFLSRQEKSAYARHK